MAGIVSYGAYIPLFRLGKATAGWEGPSERAIANFDEDSVTHGRGRPARCLDCDECSDYRRTIFR
jgi:hypothetical protein